MAAGQNQHLVNRVWCCDAQDMTARESVSSRLLPSEVSLEVQLACSPEVATLVLKLRD